MEEMKQEQAAEKAEEAKTPEEMMEIIRAESKSGTLELAVPIEDGEKVYRELKYDFAALKGLEIVRAIDDGSGSRRNSNFRLSDEQALHLFAAAAAKATGGLDAKDIIERMGAMDSIVAVQAAALFFNISSQGGVKPTGRK